MLVFLGGTCNGSTWRKELIGKLDIAYFDPVVAGWTPACQEEEIRQRNLSDFSLYVITPLMTGAYSIAEAVDDSHKKIGGVLFCYLMKDAGKVFDKHQIKSLNATGKLIQKNGGFFFTSLDEIANFLNSAKREESMNLGSVRRTIARAKQYQIQEGTEASIAAKIEEEVEEFFDAETVEKKCEELGDLLFNIFSYFTLHERDMMESFFASSRKLEGRLDKVEAFLLELGVQPGQLSEAELLAWYERVKGEERAT